MDSLAKKVNELAIYGNGEELKKLYHDTRFQISLLDNFFDSFLENFGDKLNSLDKNSRYWKVYNIKLNEYRNLKKNLPQLLYYVNKFKNV